jgi:hypothetical protein
MISKVRIVGLMDAQVEKECPAVGWLGTAKMPLAVLNKAGTCISLASMQKCDSDFDREFKAIIIANKFQDVV